MRYDDEGLDSEDDFIDDDIGDGNQEHRPKARRQGRTAGVHNQAVQVIAHSGRLHAVLNAVTDATTLLVVVQCSKQRLSGPSYNM